MTGGRCLGTFKYRQHAVLKAEQLVNVGRYRRLWVRDRDTDNFTMIRRARG